MTRLKFHWFKHLCECLGKYMSVCGHKLNPDACQRIRNAKMRIERFLADDSFNSDAFNDFFAKYGHLASAVAAINYIETDILPRYSPLYTDIDSTTVIPLEPSVLDRNYEFEFPANAVNNTRYLYCGVNDKSLLNFEPSLVFLLEPLQDDIDNFQRFFHKPKSAMKDYRLVNGNRWVKTNLLNSCAYILSSSDRRHVISLLSGCLPTTDWIPVDVFGSVDLSDKDQVLTIVRDYFSIEKHLSVATANYVYDRKNKIVRLSNIVYSYDSSLETFNDFLEVFKTNPYEAEYHMYLFFRDRANNACSVKLWFESSVRALKKGGE